MTEFEILLSEDKHLPTLRLREGGQMDPIRDQIVRGSAFAHPTPPDSRFPIPDSRFPIPHSLFPIPYSLFPIP
ncbi:MULTISPECIES: hypothetical protein [unclassified Moorena]|uniref:hypothetical protein n=1 Tax=unclassified Moorena TaxID=2683338 RepID=UPI0014012E10|nr:MULTISPECIES: hypothetical protein [unclassified Moorena]NEO17478.1 hypothetical protein [Moorena sp. SIO3E8]NEO42775.1 hypothetical protein [Moorena sp. SIO4A3]NEQ04062.1 hypothetical protein [Moorena sp. SIO3F7]NEQ63642.1 hypothetical protein [Moorena sp. SIO4A1]